MSDQSKQFDDRHQFTIDLIDKIGERKRFLNRNQTQAMKMANITEDLALTNVLIMIGDLIRGK